jgi:hypothetical protein
MAVTTERPTARPPYQAYAPITGVFVGGLGVAGLAPRVFGVTGRARRPRTMSQILAPPFDRLLAWSLAAAGINDCSAGRLAALREKAQERDSG